jgi:hypothetical protein
MNDVVLEELVSKLNSYIINREPVLARRVGLLQAEMIMDPKERQKAEQMKDQDEVNLEEKINEIVSN